MGWVFSDITQFSISIIQIVWVPWMSICLDEFWIIVSIAQFSDFWVMSYGNWKHILGVFSFQNSIFNGIFVIKPTYPAAMFNKRIFFLVKPNHNVWQILWFFFFFFGETEPQLLKLKTGSELRCQIGGLGNWGILSDEWWVISDENWVITNNDPKLIQTNAYPWDPHDLDDGNRKLSDITQNSSYPNKLLAFLAN